MNNQNILILFMRVALAIACVMSFAFMMISLASGEIPDSLLVGGGAITAVLFLLTSFVFHITKTE